MIEIPDLSLEKIRLIDALRNFPTETEWVEFKKNYYQAKLIGEYLSALSNGARLKGRQAGLLIFGIEDKTHVVVGTTFKPYVEKGEGNEDLIPWLNRCLNPRMKVEVTEGLYEGKRIVLFEVQARADRPVSFYGKSYIRIGSTKQPLSNHPELERSLWNISDDWSALICHQATYDHLVLRP